jgi:prepilin-type N-terminal cleavage/methylation domain-containing protein
MTSTSQRGVSLVETLVVVALVAIAAAVAVPSLRRASRVTNVGDAEALVRARIQTAITTAASRAVSVSLGPAALVETAGVAVNPVDVEPPAGSVTSDVIVFQPGTGYPMAAGARRAVAVVVADREDRSHASAIVVGSSATLRSYRLTPRGWEEAR